MKAGSKIVSALLTLLIVTSLAVQGFAGSERSEVTGSEQFQQALADGLLYGDGIDPFEKMERGAFVYALCNLVDGFMTDVERSVFTVKANSAAVREGMGIDKHTTVSLPQGMRLEVSEYDRGWYAVHLESVDGYIFEDELSLYPYADLTQDAYYTPYIVWAYENGVTTGAEASFRPEESLTRGEMKTILAAFAACLGAETEDDPFFAPEENDGLFVNVDAVCQVLAEYREKYASALRAQALAFEDVRSLARRQAIADFALQFVGHSYVYGTAGPNTFDCSGLVYYTLTTLGYGPVARTADDQYYSVGIPVDWSEIEPGDLVFFAGNGQAYGVTHVGIAIGGGLFVHASTSNTGVIISNLYDDYYIEVFYGAKRVVG